MDYEILIAIIIIYFTVFFGGIQQLYRYNLATIARITFRISQNNPLRVNPRVNGYNL